MSQEPDAQDWSEFMAEFRRVCPGIDGVAVSGAPPPSLTMREQVALLRSLPDNAGVERYLSAWYARGADSGWSDAGSDDRDA